MAATVVGSGGGADQVRDTEVGEQCGEGSGVSGGVTACDIEVERQESELSLGVGQRQRERTLGGTFGKNT
ncbi:hypothetical protein QLG13_27830 (plasmid) [Rhodococcus aetherivorans]|uniref:hypothetical protein n=1 Tax=Rhodococcus aetherivorans TaxID=191292 RepID=UPI0005CB27B0|nr:hypothetical protein [Rhodococcus aetherivorans]